MLLAQYHQQRVDIVIFLYLSKSFMSSFRRTIPRYEENEALYLVLHLSLVVSQLARKEVVAEQFKCNFKALKSVFFFIKLNDRNNEYKFCLIFHKLFEDDHT